MTSVQKITPNLWFKGNAKEAVDFYVGIFPNSKVVSTSHYPTEGLPDFQKEFAGKILTIDFELAGQQFTAINADNSFTFNEAVSFLVGCEDQEELDYYWGKLSSNPEAEICGWCKDKFGLSWQVAPFNMNELLGLTEGSPSPAAFQAMMKMKKIDIATLEAAGK